MSDDNDEFLYKKKLSELRVVDLKYELDRRGIDRTGLKTKVALIYQLERSLLDEGEDPNTYQFNIDVDSTSAALKNKNSPVLRRTRKSNDVGCIEGLADNDPDSDYIKLNIPNVGDEENRGSEVIKEPVTSTADTLAINSLTKTKVTEDRSSSSNNADIFGELSAKNPEPSTLSANAAEGNETVDLSKNIWVSGLDGTVTRAFHLKELFSKHGKVLGAKIVASAKGPRQRCYGFVTMADPEGANAAVENLNKSELHGKTICVKKTSRVQIIPMKKNELPETAPLAQKHEDTDEMMEEANQQIICEPGKYEMPIIPFSVKPAKKLGQKLEKNTEDIPFSRISPSYKKLKKRVTQANDETSEENMPTVSDQTSEISSEIKTKSIKSQENTDESPEAIDDGKKSLEDISGSSEDLDFEIDTKVKEGRQEVYFVDGGRMVRRPHPYERDLRSRGRELYRQERDVRSRERKSRRYCRSRERSPSRDRERYRRSASCFQRYETPPRYRDRHYSNRNEFRRLEEIRDMERRNREESYKIEKEKERLRIEKEKLERMKAEVLRREKEQQRVEREKIEEERAELRKRSFASRHGDHFEGKSKDKSLEEIIEHGLQRGSLSNLGKQLRGGRMRPNVPRGKFGNGRARDFDHSSHWLVMGNERQQSNFGPSHMHPNAGMWTHEQPHPVAPLPPPPSPSSVPPPPPVGSPQDHWNPCGPPPPPQPMNFPNMGPPMGPMPIFPGNFPRFVNRRF